MVRDALPILWVFLFVAFFSTATLADVTGSFDLQFDLVPEGTQTEAVEFFFDLKANLMLNVTLSGLTIGADLGFGTTGLEFGIVSLETNLGALGVMDQFVFAAPFSCALFPVGISNDSGGISGQCPGDSVVSIGDGNGDGIADNAIGFVKKRIFMTMNLAGITWSNLAIFEDVDFPDIQGLTGGVLAHEPDHFNGVLYDLSSINSIVDDQTPTFGFGDVITITGQTISGITVTNTVALCASNNNFLKNRNFQWEVNKTCTAQFGLNTTAIENGAKTPLLFEQETLQVSGIDFGGVNLDTSVTFVPLQPISASTTVAFSLADLASITTTFNSDNITSFELTNLTTTIASGNLNIAITDNNIDFQFDRVVATLSVVLNPNQNPADLDITLISDTNGLSSVSLGFGFTRGILKLDATSTLSDVNSNGELNWTQTVLALTATYDSSVALTATSDFSPNGLGQTSIQLGITF